MDTGRIESLFRENFTHFGDLGASLSLWESGREVLSLAGGWRDRNQTVPWTADTPVLVWSATKGPAAACVLHAMQERGIDLASPVTEFWPEFGRNGKERITLAQVLSHQTGIVTLDRTVSVFDHPATAEAIAEQSPHWEPGTSHGYSPRLHGYLLDELVRRVTGDTIRDYWRSRFADPLGLDFWIGVPPELAEVVAPVFPAKTAPARDRFHAAFSTPGSLTVRAFQSPSGLPSVASLNTTEARSTSLPGFGGIGTARALGRFYAMLACGGVQDGHALLQRSTIACMETTLAQGDDRVLLTDTAFSAGFMRDPVSPEGRKYRMLFGPSQSAFGHPGAGGSHAYADPENQIAFAYVMNQMEPGVFPGQKVLRLIETIYR